ncbi:hypothetical protein E6H17_05770 [Candidatus Bathyarchaeota archaeon]|nr:MAG: hypothetical protein E6H17_05770 [Candidatus Bathyarchaeota archaeon]
MSVRLLDTAPRWLRLTLGCSSGVLVVTGLGFFFGQLVLFDITPFTLLLHLVLALAVSSWILNLRIRIGPDRKPLLAIGVAVVVGSIWSSVQQWIGYFQTGVVSDIMLVAGATLMDIAGGCVIYTLFHLNILKK